MMRVVLMPSWLSRDLFVGFLTGAALMAILWYLATPARPSYESTLYDHCLVGNSGNTVACNAMLRLVRSGQRP
jgi:hypothetical protein